MKFNLLKTSALLCGLSLLGACAQEAPQADNKTTLGDGPRVAVPIELEVSVDAFDAPKSLDQEARAYTGAKTPITVKDGNKKVLNDDLSPNPTEAQKILTRSKAAFIAKNPKLDAVAQIYIKKGGDVKTYIKEITLTYDATKQKYTYGGDVNIDKDILENAKSADLFTLTLYAGGISYNSSTKSFEIPSIMEEVSLSDLESNPVELPLLYKSAPVAFRVDETKGVSLKPVSQAAASLKPLGSLLLLTFRNNMQQGVTFDGVTAVSNSFFGPNNVTTYKIEDGTFSTAGGTYTSPHARSSNGGATFTYFYKDFASAGFSVPTGGARSDKAILFWGFYNGDSKAASASNKLTASNGANLKTDILTPATSVLHVYAQNVKVAGRTPSRPNYNIAPIGGANLTPQNGKAYTLNCEFYDQAPQMLGYFAKGYLYKDTQWKLQDLDGNGSHEPSTYQALGDDNKLLVNAHDANEVRNGVTVSTSSPGGGGTMYMPNEDWFYLYGLTDPLEFQTGNAVRYKDLAGFATGYRGYVVKANLPYKDDPSASVPFQSKQFVYADYRPSNQTLTVGNTATVYRQLYMEPRNSAGLQPRSKYQTIMRVMASAIQDRITGDGQAPQTNTYVGAVTMESLYVGKYFVGNVMTTPLYVNRSASQPFLYAEDGDAFWHKPEVALDRVDRAGLSVRTYAYGQIQKDDLMKDYSALTGKKRAEAHLFIHWCDGAMEAEFMSNSSTKDALFNKINSPIAGRGEEQKLLNRTYSFADVKGGIWTINKRVATDDIAPRLRSNSFQALRPYSRQYQGNEGFRNNND